MIKFILGMIAGGTILYFAAWYALAKNMEKWW